MFFTENSRYQWSIQTIKLLIEEVKEHVSILNNKNSIQRKVWKEIASSFNKRGYNVSDEQYAIKWKNLKQKYKSVLDANSKTGRAKVSWEYFDAIDDVMNTTPEIRPESLVSSTHGFRLHKRTINIENVESDNENIAPENLNDMRHIRKRLRKKYETNYYVTKNCMSKEKCIIGKI